MVFSNTERGFAIARFADLYGIECSAQDSSLATEAALWLGPSAANPKRLVAGKGWQDAPLPDDVSCTTRMHLNEAQARELIVVLQRFVDTGSVQP